MSSEEGLTTKVSGNAALSGFMMKHDVLNAALAEKMRQLMAHGDEIVLGAHSGDLEQVISIRIMSGGRVATRWTGFNGATDLLGALIVGQRMIEAQVHGES